MTQNTNPNNFSTPTAPSPQTTPTLCTPSSPPSPPPKRQKLLRWTRKQELKLATFLIYFHDFLQNPHQRKGPRIYELMSEMIGSRNRKQCKNYFMKKMKGGNSVKQAIERIKAKSQRHSFEQQILRYRKLASSLRFNQGQSQEPQLADTQSQPEIHSANDSHSLSITTNPNIYPSLNVPSSCLSAVNVVKDKSELFKTKAYTSQSYSLGQAQDMQCQDDIPLMRIDSCSQAEQQSGCLDHSNTCQYETPSPTKPLFSHDENGAHQLSAYGVKYYMRERRKREAEREVHLANIQYLSHKLMKQKEEIKYFESAIKLLHLNFNMAQPLI